MKKILMAEMIETESTLGQDMEDDVSSIQVPIYNAIVILYWVIYEYMDYSSNKFNL